jgi:two-component system chemotaxis sensor kinase CheA
VEAKGERVEDRNMNIVVLQADKYECGLVVDAVHDTAEIVVRPLGRHFKNTSVFSGAAIMGDGSVALILDVIGILRREGSVVRVPEESRKALTVSTEAAAGERQALLIVCHGQERRGAIPLGLVTRLEELSPCAIEKSGLRQVIQYRGAIMPLIRLSHVLGGNAPAEDQHDTKIRVVVHSNAGRMAGLVVDQIVDIVEGRVAVTRDDHTPGIHGSAVIQGHVTDILDVRAIIESAEPGFFDQPAAA